MEKLKSILSNIWLWLGVIFTGLLAILMFQRSRRKDAESSLELADSDKNSAVLDERKSNNDAMLSKLEEEKKAAQANTANEDADKLADWFKKRE